MHLIRLLTFSLATASAAPALGREIGEVPSNNSYNLLLSLPGSIIAEIKVTDSLAAGLYFDRGLDGNEPSGRRSRDADSEEEDRTEVSSSIVGFQAHWRPSGQVFTDGFYVSPFIGYVTAKLKSSATGFSAKGSGVTLGVIGGYGWFWENGVNIGVGLGAKYNTLTVGDRSYTSKDGSVQELKTDRLRDLSPTGEFTLGFAF